MTLIAQFPILVEDELDADDPSLRDDTRSSDVYEVLVCDFSHSDTGFVGCVAPLGHTGKHTLPTKSVAA